MLSRNSVGWTIFSVIMLVLSIYFAIVVISSPVTMAVAGWLYLGISLITYGIFRVSMYSRLKTLNKMTDGML